MSLASAPRQSSRLLRHVLRSPYSTTTTCLNQSRPAIPSSTPALLHQLRPASPSYSTQSSLQCRARPSSYRSSIQPQRCFSTSPSVSHGHLHTPKPGDERKVTFIDKDGDEHTFVVADGDNLLDIAQANELEMEGACGGSCACSTCHVIVSDPNMFDQMPEPDDDENDMLDLAFGLTETSRLGCQVTMTPELDGLVVKLPSMTRNLQASDFSKK